MAKTRDEKRPKRQRDQPPGVVLAERVRPLLLPAAVALLVAPHLVPSEAVASDGTHALPSMLWCVLLVVWGTVTAFSKEARVRFTWSDAALLLLVGLHTVSGVIPREGIVTRNAWNVVWLWISYGIAYFLLRQLLVTSVQTRAVLAVAIGLAICLTAHAYYQYFVAMPAVRAEYQANPEKVLRESNVPSAADSPARRHFEDRVQAVEPLSTFALTNSLAGFLAPWTVLLAGLALVLWQSGHHRSLPMTALAAAVLLFGCLLLTKSRTALLAVISGGVLVSLFGRIGAWRLDWRLPAAVGGVLLLLGVGAVAVGGLDAKVLSEAPKSVLYRLEYWRSTAAMIGDYPLWGCGPGNFQDYYTRYKLPQASETIADPHNVLLEVWATAGTPALAALLAWMGVLAFDLGRRRDEPTFVEPEKSDDSAKVGNAIGGIYVGALLGIALGFGLAFLTDFPLWTKGSGGQIGLLLVGLPLAGLVLLLLRPWVWGGPTPVSLLAIGLVTLLVNLCAAGAASFPGVVSSALVLAACAMGGAPARWPSWLLPRAYGFGLIAAPLLIGVACFWTEYSPVLKCLGLMYEAEALLGDSPRSAARLAQAIDRWYAAAAADPASSEPWERLAGVHLQEWLAHGSDEAWERFTNAADQLQHLRPASHRQHAQRGEWFLQAFRHSGRSEHLTLSRDAFQAAVDRYPASAMAHAQVAWVRHLAGDDEAARAEAAEALRLDALNPHEEFKLRNTRLSDPVRDQGIPGGWRMERTEPAEQTMEKLRKELSTPEKSGN